MAKQRTIEPALGRDPYSLAVELVVLLKVGAVRLRTEGRPAAMEGHDDWLHDAVKLAAELQAKLKPTVLQ
jgi:hypothetical protein